jgi:hypothetical protein
MKKHILVFCVCLLSIFVNGCKGEFFGPGTSDYMYELSGGYRLAHIGETYISRANSIAKVIEANVTGIAWDEDFILVEQKKDKDTGYWIISATNNRIYGAFGKDEFDKEREKLKASSELKLVNPEKYKRLEKRN